MAAEIKFTSFQIDTITTGNRMPYWLNDLRFSIELGEEEEEGGGGGAAAGGLRFECAAIMRGIITDPDVTV